MKLESLTVHEDNLNITNKYTNIQLPSHWKFVRLEEICLDKPQNGAFIKSPEFGEGTLFVNVYDIYQNVKLNWSGVERLLCSNSLIKTYLLRENDLLFVRSSLKLEGIGQCCLIGHLDEPAIFDCHLIRVSPDIAKVDPFYVAYYFSSHIGKRDLMARSKTTTMTTINQNTLAKSLVPLPSLPEQYAIAHSLQTVQQAIQTRRKELELEREHKAALIQYLFTYGIRNEPTKQSEVGEIPESWEVRSLGEVLRNAQYGLSLMGKLNGTYPILRMNSLVDGTIVYKDLQYVDIDKKTFIKFRLNHGDILFNRTNSADLVGKTALFDKDYPTVFASYLIRITTDEKQLCPDFLNWYFNWEIVQRRLRSIASRGVSQANISASKLQTFKIPIPPLLKEQTEIANVFNLHSAKISAIEKEIALHEELFHALLDELMTGRRSTLPLIEQLEKGTLTHGQRTPDGTGTTH